MGNMKDMARLEFKLLNIKLKKKGFGFQKRREMMEHEFDGLTRSEIEKRIRL